MSKTVENWIEELQSQDKIIRGEAVRALSYMGNEAIDPLIAALKTTHTDPKVLAEVMGQIGIDALNAVTDVLQQGDVSQRHMAAEVLALIADPRTVVSIVMGMEDPEAEVRSAVAQALGSFSDPRATSPLIEALQDPDSSVRASAAASLGRYFRDPRVTKALLSAIEDSVAEVRAGAVRGLTYIDVDEVTAAIKNAIQDDDEEVRHLAAAALQHREGDHMVFERMRDDVTGQVKDIAAQLLEDGTLDENDIDLMRNSNPRIRARLLEMVSDKGSATAVKLLLPGLNDINPAVRKTAVTSLTNLGKNAVEPLIEALSHKSHYVSVGAIEALGIIGDERMIDPTIRLLKNESEMVRLQAARALAQFEGHDEIARALTPLLKDADNDVRQEAVQALEKLGYDPSNAVKRFFRRFTGRD